MADWYCGSTKHAAITQWAALTAYNVGDIRRQLAAPAVGSERAFRCTTAGTSGAAEPSWTLTKAGTTNDATVVWTEVTGNSAWGWTAAAARATLFGTWAAAGDRVWISNNHAETQAAHLTITSSGTLASLVRYICVDDASAPPTTKATTAVIETTGAFYIVVDGHAYFYGITFRAGVGAGGAYAVLMNNTAIGYQVYESCVLESGKTDAGNTISVGIGTTVIKLINTSLKFAHVNSSVVIRCAFEWYGGSILGTVPTNLFGTVFLGASRGIIRGVDLSALGSGKNIVSVTSSALSNPEVLFDSCKLGSAVTLVTGTHTLNSGRYRFVNSDSADTNYRYFVSEPMGTIIQESTIVRTGGASDGTTPISRKMVSSANAKIDTPLVMDDIVFWNETIGSAQTAVVEAVSDGVTFTDAELWAEVEPLGTSGFPLSTFVNDRVADSVFGTPANQTTSSVAWTTTGIASPVKQKLEVPFTAQEKGWVRIRVMLAKASSTVWVCPKVDGLGTSTRQAQVGPLYAMSGSEGAGGTMGIPQTLHTIESGIAA